MKFDEALERFSKELAIEYGEPEPIIKIGVPNNLYDKIVYEVASARAYRFGFRDLSRGLRIYGVSIVPVERDNF